jgi:hypothetical protein
MRTTRLSREEFIIYLTLKLSEPQPRERRKGERCGNRNFTDPSQSKAKKRKHRNKDGEKDVKRITPSA